MFIDFVASDALSLTKECRRHTNYVHPLKYEEGCSIERRS